MSRIFICYRREDSSGHTGRLSDSLKRQFGRDNIFLDVSDIEGGEDFIDRIRTTISSCDILIVAIGSHWHLIADAKGRRRLENTEDSVRLEIETALANNIPVIPILFQRAMMPNPSELPEPLKPLARLNAIEITDSRWDYDVEKLVEILRKKVTGISRGRLSRSSKYSVPIGLIVFTIAGWLTWMEIDHYRNYARNIADLTGRISYDRPMSEALDNIRKLTDYVGSLKGSIEAENLAIGKLKPMLADKDPGNRRVRRAIIEAMKQIRQGDLRSDFKDGTAEQIDLIGADLSNADLSKISFRSAFLIETSFRGTNLSGADFSDAYIRNVKFSGAQLKGVDFSGADWFNSVGLTKAQLETVDFTALIPCPSEKGSFVEKGFQQYLKKAYVYPFESWTPQVQTEILLAWHEYGKRGGLCELVNKKHAGKKVVGTPS